MPSFIKKMPRQKYKLNTESLNFEVIKIPFRHKTRRFIFLFVMSIVLFFAYTQLYSHFFESPKIMLLKSQNTNIQLKYDLLLKDVENADEIITQINNRDENLYRTIFALDKISYTTAKRKTDFQKSNLFNDVAKTFTVLDDFRRKVYIQSKSFDEISQYAADMEKMTLCMPAIPPIDLRKMRSYDRFGMRKDPFNGLPRFHAGNDLSGDVGTPIYATGDGTVVRANYSPSYGNVIDIDHGFGYLTRYAHLSEILVPEGKKVKRGEKIGLMGSTGSRSTGPHLHYEVRLRGEPTNPRKFFIQPSDVNYNEIINKAKHEQMEIR